MINSLGTREAECETSFGLAILFYFVTSIGGKSGKNVYLPVYRAYWLAVPPAECITKASYLRYRNEFRLLKWRYNGCVG